MQSEFSFPLHAAENNYESQNHLQKNKIHFSKKCIELLRRLCNGERLIFADEVKRIGDLRRRSLDLIQKGIPVKRIFKEQSENEKSHNIPPIKEYFLEKSDIDWIKLAYSEILLP